MSKGTGDLNIKCEVVDRMLVSETYTLEDCLLYDSTTHNTSDELVNFTISTPNKVQVEFDFTKGASGSGAFVRLGDDGNNCLQVGLLGSGNYGFWVQHNGSTVTQQIAGGLTNGTYPTVLTYDNGSITCTINNVTKTYTYTQPLTKLVSYHPWNSGNLKNMKIKPL